MAMGTNLIIFTFCLSFAFLIMGIGTPPIFDLVSCFEDTNHSIQTGGPPGYNTVHTCAIPGGNLFSTSTGQILTIAGVAGVSTGLILITGATTFFSIVGLILFGLLTFPPTLFLKEFMPYELRLLFGGLYTICYTIAIVSWLKIGGTP